MGIVKLWIKSVCLSLFLALIVQILTTKMGNGNENLPSAGECENLRRQNSIKRFQTLEQFYPFYLCEHTLGLTKLFHFVTTVNASVIFYVLLARKWQWKLLIFGLIQGYGIAWISHFFIEQNQPATFTYPAYSFVSDYKMFSQAVMLKFPPFF